jgi:hypothetical protein
MNAWGALQYVSSGLSLVAFGIAAILLAYRARLAHRAEIIKSAPETDRLDAIAITAELDPGRTRQGSGRCSLAHNPCHNGRGRCP